MALDYKLIGNRIKTIRTQKALTQENLAEKLDVSIAFLSRVERGTIQISLKRLSQICDLLEISEGVLLNGTSTDSKDYLNDELFSLLKDCPSDKSKLIYHIAKLIKEN